MINQNSKVTKEIKEGLGLSELTGYPRRIADAIIPVLPVGIKKDNFVKTDVAANSTGTVLYTTPADKNTYITGFVLTLIKDANATSLASSIVCIIDGQTTFLGRIASLTLTAQSEVLAFKLPYPLKVDRNTAISVTNSTNVGNVTAYGSVYGYTEDTTGD